MPPKKASEVKIEPSIKLSMEALIRARNEVSYARNMIGDGSNYDVAIAAIEKAQDTLLARHPKGMTNEQKAGIYPGLADRLGIHSGDK